MCSPNLFAEKSNYDFVSRFLVVKHSLSSSFLLQITFSNWLLPICPISAFLAVRDVMKYICCDDDDNLKEQYNSSLKLASLKIHCIHS